MSPSVIQPSKHNEIKDMHFDDSMLYLYAHGIYKHTLKYKTKLCFKFVNGVCPGIPPHTVEPAHSLMAKRSSARMLRTNRKRGMRETGTC